MKAVRVWLGAILLLPLVEVRPASAQVAAETIDFFTTNVVRVQLGQEGVDEGLKHLDKQADGRTTVERLDGVPCRYLNRTPEGKTFGYIYFAIHPDFKERPLKTVRIEVEYLVTHSGFLRLQYDAIEGDVPKSYKGVAAHGGPKVKLAPTAEFTRTVGTNAWQKATFFVTDSAFRNSQNGKADFRLEVSPAEIYVRRVTLTREDAQASPP